jgi:hypothetical protein
MLSLDYFIVNFNHRIQCIASTQLTQAKAFKIIFFIIVFAAEAAGFH